MTLSYGQFGGTDAHEGNRYTTKQKWREGGEGGIKAERKRRMGGGGESLIRGGGKGVTSVMKGQEGHTTKGVGGKEKTGG